MQMSSPAKRTCSACSSASEYTATVLMPSSRQAWITRMAISPRFAIRIFLNMPLLCLDREQPLAKLHRLAVLDVDLHDLAVILRVDLVHQLHRFDDAQYLAALDGVADVGKGTRSRLGRAIEGAHDRRLDDGELELAFVLTGGWRESGRGGRRGGRGWRPRRRGGRRALRRGR